MSFRLFYILLIFAAVKCGEGIWAQEEGLASYYHHRFHGRKSSSGRVHDKEELVAAHRTYPFGTFLRVTNLENMKSTIVCVDLVIENESLMYQRAPPRYWILSIKVSLRYG